MALSSVALEIALFQVIEVPYATKSNVIVGDALLAETHDVTGSSRAAYTLIMSQVNSMVAGAVTELESLLTTWRNLGTDVVSIDGGSIGNLQGVSDSAAAEREEIRKQVLVLVPFYRYHEELSRRRGLTVPIIR